MTMMRKIFSRSSCFFPSISVLLAFIIVFSLCPTALAQIGHGSSNGVERGPVDHIILLPDSATIASGQTQSYVVTAYDSRGNIWDATDDTKFSIDDDAGGSWSHNTYTSEFAGTWTVTGKYKGSTDDSILTVTQEQQALPPGVTTTLVSPDKDTEVKSPSGRITVGIPQGALKKQASIEFTEYWPGESTGMQIVSLFELNASDSASKDKINKFDKELKISIQHTPEELAGLDIDSLRLYYLDEDTGQWLPLENSKFDKEKNQITATTNHFTHFGEMANPTIVGPGRVMAAQVGLQSGTAIFSYPLELPPGPGGFQPKLELTYSSGSVDGMKNKQSVGSWVGIGWSLKLGSISYDSGTGRYFLDLNGASYRLLNNGDGTYSTNPEQYIKITRSGNTWNVYDTDGTYYRFGGTTDSQQYTAGTYYRWDLSLMQDTNGNQATISYARDIRGTAPSDTVRAAYSEYITYGNVQIHFVVGYDENDPTDGYLRYDNPKTYGSNAAPKVMETRWLDYIEIKVSGTLIRKYDFTYNTTTRVYSSNYGGIYYSGKHTLTSITEIGADGTSQLPATTFTYDDLQIYRNDPAQTQYTGNPGNPASLNWPHLTAIDSGYGGSISFSYTQIPDTSATNIWTREVVTSKTVDSGIGTTQTYTYTYNDGPKYYLSADYYAEYRGFDIVKETDAAGNYTRHWFYTTGTVNGKNADELTGREYQTNWYDSSNNLLGTKTYDWNYQQTKTQEVEPSTYVAKFGSWVDGSWTYCLKKPQGVALSPDGQYVYVASDQVQYYWTNDPNTTYTADANYIVKFTAGVHANWKVQLDQTEETVGTKTSRTRYVYDSYGNVVTQYLDGDTSTSADDATVWRTFYPNTTANILNKPARERVYATIVTSDVGGANLRKETLYYYDSNNTSNATPPTKGNRTRIEQKVNASSSVSSYFTYDSYGNMLTSQDANGNTTTWTYDSTYHTYPTAISYPITGLSESAAYDPGTNNVLTHTDMNGQVTTYQYDTFKRLIKVIKPGDSSASPSIEYQYNNWGTLGQQHLKTITKVAEGDYLWQSDYFDGIGRVVQTQARGETGRTIISTTTVYNNCGQVDRQYVSQDLDSSEVNGYEEPDGDWKYASYVYDGLSRVTTQTSADGTTVSTDYSTAWQVLTTNQNGYKKRYYNDAFGRLVKVEELDASQQVYATTNYTYNTLGNLIQVVDNNGNITTRTYDWLSRKTAMTDPDMGSWTYGYDNNANLITQTDAKGQTVTMTYDAMNRTIAKTYPVGSGMTNVAYTYDSTEGGNYGKGQRTGMSDALGTTSYKYDARGRFIEEKRTVDSVDYTTQFAYDGANRVTAITYPTGEVVTQGFNGRGLSYSLSGSIAGNLVTSTLYNSLGSVTEINLGNGLRTTFGYYGTGGSYDTSGGYYGRLWEIKTLPQAGGTTIQDIIHTWDAGGNLSQRQDVLTSETETFTYDFLDRLLTASGPYSESYAYNQIGNITSMNGVAYTYGTQPHAVTAVGTTAYAYDANGNMTTRGSQTLTWDVENRVLSVIDGENTSTFVYDGNGSRVKKTENGETILYINAYYEKNLTTGEVTTSYYLGGRLIAQMKGSTLNYIHQDHLTGTSVVSDSSGVLVSSIKYYPFGATRSGSVPTDKQFTGQRLDSTGLYYYGARYYDATIGRFISADPVVSNPANPQSFNRYSYCLNNPLKYVDPSGYSEDTEDNHIEVYPEYDENGNIVGYYIYIPSVGCWGYASSWDQIAELFPNTDIYYWDPTTNTFIYAYYDPELGWMGAVYAEYDPDSGIWVYHHTWRGDFRIFSIDMKSWGEVGHITNPGDLRDPRGMSIQDWITFLDALSLFSDVFGPFGWVISTTASSISFGLNCKLYLNGEITKDELARLLMLYGTSVSPIGVISEAIQLWLDTQNNDEEDK